MSSAESGAVLGDATEGSGTIYEPSAGGAGGKTVARCRWRFFTTFTDFLAEALIDPSTCLDNLSREASCTVKLRDAAAGLELISSSLVRIFSLLLVGACATALVLLATTCGAETALSVGVLDLLLTLLGH
jgi:hypothetical protein